MSDDGLDTVVRIKYNPVARVNSSIPHLSMILSWKLIEELGEAVVEGDVDGAPVGSDPVLLSVSELGESLGTELGESLGTELGESDAKIVCSPEAPDGVPPFVGGDAAGASPGASLGLEGSEL
jgi:hypothetical protein